jgi:hypothetical protein
MPANYIARRRGAVMNSAIKGQMQSGNAVVTAAPRATDEQNSTHAGRSSGLWMGHFGSRRSGTRRGATRGAEGRTHPIRPVNSMLMASCEMQVMPDLLGPEQRASEQPRAKRWKSRPKYAAPTRLCCASCCATVAWPWLKFYALTAAA